MHKSKIILKNGGYKYSILKRIGSLAILYGTNKYDSFTYEVVKVRKYNTDKILPNGSVIPTGTEYYPSNNEWGIYGFTASNLTDAKRILKEWVKAQDVA